MPATLAFALFSAGAPLAVVNAVAGVTAAGVILHAAGSIAISVGLSLAANALLRPTGPKPSDGQQEFQQPIPPRVFHYGRLKVSGPIWFFDVSPTSNLGRELWRGVLLSAREADAFVTHWLDDIALTINGAGLVTNHFGDLVHIYPQLGTDSQAVVSALNTAFTAIGTNHRNRGIAHAVMTFNQGGNPDDYQFIYPNGIPTLTTLGDWAKLYDPRLDTTTGGSGAHRHDDKSTWAYSDNAGLAILDYLTHVEGYNRPIAKIELASFRSFADVCDENVPLKAGGTEKRYRIAATVSLSEPRSQALRRLLDACDADLYSTADGKVAIRGGEWVAPTVTLDADSGDIIEAEFAPPSALERYNELAIQFMSPAHGYSEIEGDPWQNAADILATGIIETRPFDVLQVPSHGQARRLAKIRMARDNPEWRGEIRTNFYGLDAIGERVVTIKFPELGIDGPFYIEAATLLGDGTGMGLQIRSADPDAYDWNAAAEEGTEPPVPPDISGAG